MEQVTAKIGKGFTDTGLKMTALIFMMLDHIYYFFEYTGKIPLWFTALGRLSAPIFLFCLCEGFAHTRNRKKYFLQIYGISIVMGGIRYFMQWANVLVRPDGFFPQNAMLSSFVILLVMWQGMDWIKEKKYLPGAAAIALPVIWPFLAALINGTITQSAFVISISCYTILPAWGLNMSPDCTLPILLAGIILYAFRKNRKLQVLAFSGFYFLYYFVYLGIMASKSIEGFAWGQMFTIYFEWYGVFAVLFMLLYNGKRGKGYKRLFYVFYPAHIYLLYALSWAVMIGLKYF